ncbi:hypothetical protein QJS04_geneDACA004318 [Acorus gramineus]|uniref:Transmembrane protein n=1 Tax=Acorus gramineus TaxID=55184 RepID=A0AAV9B4Y2_ACOGR|nr:hypothetical protein QJS04_geneDACA004318 [Acorus gramineus]
MANQTHLFLLNLLSKRRTWVSLFIIVYGLLLYSCWSLLLSILSWYSSTSSSGGGGTGWAALYASVLFGGVFGILSMAAAAAVAVPATLVTWITVLVLLAFCGRPRTSLVEEGRRLTAEISGFAVRIVLREGNIVAAVCALLSFLVLLRRRTQQDENTSL